MNASDHRSEVAAGERFEFGENWRRFLQSLNESRVQQATDSLRTMLGMCELAGRRFLDAGSGSGLSSLAARRLGASVHSFDYDPASVACTEELRRRFEQDASQWRVERGSVLDQDYMAALGGFDVVYSWGVLHHTGRQWEAIDNVARLVNPGGFLFIALYNDQGWISKYWSAVKHAYNRLRFMRPVIVAAHLPYLAARVAVRAATGRLRQADRGMSLWHDLIDWLGGWPFEVSRPQEVLEFCAARGFEPVKVVTVGARQGCNEFVFSRRRET